MRKIAFLAIVLAFAGCSKDDFNPSRPKNGQKADLFVDHYRDVRNQMIFLLPQKNPSTLSLGGFQERELGYTYKVKAKVYVSPQPVMDDGANSWFEFVEVISKERYSGSDVFEIGLVYGMGFGGSGGNLAVKKEGDRYTYGAGGELRPINAAVKEQLDEYLAKEKAISNSQNYIEYQQYLSKLALKAIVSHDPENYGKGYVLHEIKSGS
jgi:hypothetical protein